MVQNKLCAARLNAQRIRYIYHRIGDIIFVPFYTVVVHPLYERSAKGSELYKAKNEIFRLDSNKKLIPTFHCQPTNSCVQRYRSMDRIHLYFIKSRRILSFFS